MQRMEPNTTSSKPPTPPSRPPRPSPLQAPPVEPSVSLPRAQSNTSYVSAISPKDEFPDSPLRDKSSARSDERERPNNGSSGAIVAVEKYYSPLTSPLPVTPPKDTPDSMSLSRPRSNSNSNPNAHVINFNRREETTSAAAVVMSSGGGGGAERGGVLGRKRTFSWKGGGLGDVEEVVNRSKKENTMRKVALGLRMFELAVCLISFSIMASDKTQGWSGDSFDRYREYRFCLSANVIGFAYSSFQAYDLAYHLVTGKHVIAQHLRYHFDFAMDQILSYLLIAASSASATRVVDWISNWGKDEFTEKASVSISMSFLAFISFAFSSLVSGYNFFNREST